MWRSIAESFLPKVPKIPVCINLDADVAHATRDINRSKMINKLIKDLISNATFFDIDIVQRPEPLPALVPIIEVAKQRGITRDVLKRYRDKAREHGINLSVQRAYQELREATK
jgi:transcriptional/translational regulatory protein YebC/TACO1